MKNFADWAVLVRKNVDKIFVFYLFDVLLVTYDFVFCFFRQSIDEPNHFGVICRDPNSANVYLGYVFKCESDSVVTEIIGGDVYTYTHNLVPILYIPMCSILFQARNS